MSEEQTGTSSNADKVTSGTEIKLGGQTHFLKYTLWSFCKIDEVTGKNPLDGATWEDVHPKDILVLLWAGLLHEKLALTLEELGERIELHEIKTLAPIIQQAFAQSASAAEEKKSSPE
jgi:hypothetical protein